MNKAYIFLAVLVFTSITSSAQFTKSYKALEAKATAINSAELTNAKLSMVATIADTTGLGVPAELGAFIKFQFDIQTGNAGFWAYTVVGQSGGVDTSITKIFIKSIVNQYTALPFPVPDLGEEIQTGLALPDNVIDSDVMAANLRKSAEFKSYQSSYTNARVQLAALLNSDEQPFNGAYWTVLVGSDNGPQMPCFVPATDPNAEAMCFAVTSVEEKQVEEMNIFPNPSSDFATLSIPVQDYNPNATILVMNIVGEIVYQATNVQAAGGYNVVIPTSALPSGKYLVRYSGMRSSKIIPLTIEH